MKASEAGARLFFPGTLDYLDSYLPRQVGRGRHTVKAYRDALTVSRRYLFEGCGLPLKTFCFKDCDKTLLLEFVACLKEQGCSATTCNQRISAIKSYVWFAADKDMALLSVAISVSRVPQLKAESQVKQVLSPEALSALFAAPADSRVGLRDRTILILPYDAAVRLDGLLSLTLAETNLHNLESPSIRVYGKGNKERVVAITSRTAEHLRSYIKACHSGPSEGGDYLFYTGQPGSRHKMSGANAERIVKKYANKARAVCGDIPEKVHPHMFRRTRATEPCQNGVPLELVSRMLGHASTETTKIYAAPSIEMLRAALESVDNPADEPEEQLWCGSEDELARLYGLR